MISAIGWGGEVSFLRSGGRRLLCVEGRLFCLDERWGGVFFCAPLPLLLAALGGGGAFFFPPSKLKFL